MKKMNKLVDEIEALIKSYGIEVYANWFDHSSLHFDIDYEPEGVIPDEILPFVWKNPSDVERAIYKGNTRKQSSIGAQYELALSDFLHRKLRDHPDHYALDWETFPVQEDMKNYEANRQRIWDELQETYKHYIADLEENFI